jgi:hypothetical protein
LVSLRDGFGRVPTFAMEAKTPSQKLRVSHRGTGLGTDSRRSGPGDAFPAVAIRNNDLIINRLQGLEKISAWGIALK